MSITLGAVCLHRIELLEIRSKMDSNLSKSVMKDTRWRSRWYLYFLLIRRVTDGHLSVLASVYSTIAIAFLRVPRNSIYGNMRTLALSLLELGWTSLMLLRARIMNMVFSVCTDFTFRIFSTENLDSVLRFLFSTFDS